MTGEWKWLVNLLVALLFLAGAVFLTLQESFFMAGKRDPTHGRYFTGEALRLLILALSCMAVHAGYWAWRLSRPAQEVADQGYWLPVVLVAVALFSGGLAYQKAEIGAAPGAVGQDRHR